MAFEATKKEWSEIYSVLRLLSDGAVYAGTSEVKRNEAEYLPVAMLQREEHDGTRCYIVEGDDIHIKGEKIDKLVPREDFGEAAGRILKAMKESSDDSVESPEGVEEFLDEVLIYDLEAKTDDLEQHYIRDFGARPVASLYPDGPKTFMIADEAAKNIFSSYLF